MSGNVEKIKDFQQQIYTYYTTYGRMFAWRQTDNPYHIVVSEIMLQQTQTHRVEHKYAAFIAQFPTFNALAQAPVCDVIVAWQGLGYNRRALALQKTAQKIMQEHAGTLPASPEILETFPGIGPATASSICAFAFNMPTIFIETNIRAVFIHFFFPEQTNVHDKEIFPLVGQSVDRTNARHWYYALMDYGVMLKKQNKNPSRKSAHYTKQSTFEGSERQIRGMVLRALAEHVMLSFDSLCLLIPRTPERIERNLYALVEEGFIEQKNHLFLLQK